MKKKQLTKTAMIERNAKKGANANFLLELGRRFPTTPAQLKRFCRLDVLGKPDVDFIVEIFPEATFRRTSSGLFARLNEFEEFKAALSLTI